MSYSEAPESGKADSGRTPAQADTGNTPAIPTGPRSTTDTAANSSNNTTPSHEQWTTIPFRRAPATRGRGGSAARAYYNPANRGVNTRGRGAWNNSDPGRAPARHTTSGYTAATSFNSWANGPPRGSPAAFTTPRSTGQSYRGRPGPQHGFAQPTTPSSTARPSNQASTARPPNDGWASLNRFVTGQARAPAPTQTVTIGEPPDAPRTPVATEATLKVFHSASTTEAATEPVIERAAVGEPTNERAKTTTDGKPEPNIELPETAHSLMSPLIDYEPLMPRKSWNQSGREANVSINSYRVTSFPDKKVYQYDILIGNGIEKRGLIRSVWESQAVKSEIGEFFIFDGNRIGWSMRLFGNELKFEVDLDKERSTPAKEGRPPNKHRVIIRKTNEVNLSALKYYLERKAVFDNSVLEAINFLDHLLRETPSKTNIAMKRSYFSREKLGKEGNNLGGKKDLTGGVEALKGVYQSIRMAEGGKLVINADVSNSTFWKDSTLAILTKEIVKASRMEDVPSKIKPIQGGGATGAMRESPSFGALRRLCKNEIKIKHRGCSKSVENKTFRIERIREESARNSSIEITDKVTGTKQMMSVERYFAIKHNVYLNHPDFPLVEVGNKGALYPMELCHMVYGQRYPYKLDRDQTSNMIKFAVSIPKARKEAIKEKVTRLDWEHDPFLNSYGLKIEPNMLKTKARVLNPPEVMFTQPNYNPKVSAKPGTSGKWNLAGKRFLQGNTIPLKYWGLYVQEHAKAPPLYLVKDFLAAFARKYQEHGGRIDPDPVISSGIHNGAGAVKNLVEKTLSAHKQYPQLMFFVLRDQTIDYYSQIKSAADCVYGVVSQCVQSSHVIKCNPQYLSNVCMKVNAKLGGTTSQIKSAIRGGSDFQVPTMIIGADVSHAAPGSSEASFAAITVSMDRICARYAAAVETNGFRVEMITTKNIEKMLTPLIEHWKRAVGGGKGPSHVYYFRDGVSAGQYQAVLKYEVEAMKQLFAKLAREKNYKPKFTVVIAEKRHHIRFFLDSGNLPENPLPGTLVERDVTHPFEYDFYLCSHKAIQGTARPTHYHVLKDECELRGDSFQNMIYEHCYQYMRSTTAVALFPAVYYAHLASNRARSHLDQSETRVVQRKTTSARADLDAEPKPLLEMPNNRGIQTSMWYI